MNLFSFNILKTILGMWLKKTHKIDECSSVKVLQVSFRCHFAFVRFAFKLRKVSVLSPLINWLR